MTDIFFTSEEHKKRLIETMQGLGKIDGKKLDPEYASALYVLSSNTFTWEKAQEYVSRYGIDLSTMLEEIDLSGGESVLLQWAGNLFNSQLHNEREETNVFNGRKT